jgi:hypothetical protein
MPELGDKVVCLEATIAKAMKDRTKIERLKSPKTRTLHLSNAGTIVTSYGAK